MPTVSVGRDRLFDALGRTYSKNFLLFNILWSISSPVQYSVDILMVNARPCLQLKKSSMNFVSNLELNWTMW